MGVAKNLLDASKATYTSLENRLSGVFKTIAPRREFVRSLGRQIRLHPPAITQRLKDVHYILILLAGLFSLAAIVYISVRTVVSFFTGTRRTPRQA